MNGFYWLIPKVLAGSSRPGGRSGNAKESAQLETDLRWLRNQNIDAILTLTEVGLDQDLIDRFGFINLHIPIIDMTAPSSSEISDALAFIDQQTARGRSVVVHCLVGQGRTGTMLAAYLIRTGLSPELAISDLRSVCPHAVENTLQERALVEFAARRDWVI